VVTNRIYKQSGLNDLEQLETAPEYDPKEQLTAKSIDKYLKPSNARLLRQLSHDTGFVARRGLVA